MSTIDLEHPLDCQFCSSGEKTRPILLPWRHCEGWWSCSACKDKAVKRMYDIMNKRRIIGTSTLPEWFREWGLFSVKRSSGTLTDMILVDFPCQFSQNLENGENTDGRVRLSGGDIYVDMCTDDNAVFKQVMLQNLYENNPALHDNPILELAFPPYVDAAAQREWQAAVIKAVTAGKKKFSDPPADELTDDEGATPTESNAPATLAIDEPVNNDLAIDEPVSDDLAIDEPVSDDLAIDEPVNNDLAIDEPVSDESAKEPATEEKATLTQISFWDE